MYTLHNVLSTHDISAQTSHARALHIQQSSATTCIHTVMPLIYIFLSTATCACIYIYDINIALALA